MRMRPTGIALTLLLVASLGCSETDRTRWLARFGSTPAQTELGLRLVDAEGAERNLEEGIGWLERAAGNGSGVARERLVALYRERGIGDDLERAEHWLREGAEAGDAGDAVELATLLALRGDPEAESWLERAARSGDPDALFRFAQYLHQRDEGDPAIRANLQKAAEQGHGQAAWELARLLMGGDELPEGERGERAMLWLQRAAESDHAPAQSALGVLHFRGKGVEQDHAEAHTWFLRAAEQGDAVAQESLGLLYREGWGVVRSPTEAERWLRLAAEQDRPAAMAQLGLMYSEGLLPDEETAEQMEYYTTGSGQHAADVEEHLDALAEQARVRNDRRAVQWLRRAVAKDYAPAMTRLASMLEEGRGVDEPDPDEAMRLYEKAAGLGNGAAQAALAARYGAGEGVEQDDSASLEHYRAAAESGHALSQYALARRYLTGRGVPRDTAKAAHWLRKAAEGGVAAAESSYGTLLASGEGVKQDDEEALVWFQRAAERDEAAAQWNMGVFYEEGRGGLRKSQRHAVEWWKKAAEQGHPYAQLKLGLAYAQGKGTRRDLAEAHAWLSLSDSDQVDQWLEVIEGRMLPADQKRATARLAELRAAAAEQDSASDE